MVSNEALAYAAGIVDGEGSISIFRTGRSLIPTIRVDVGMTHFGVISWLRQMFGGTDTQTFAGRNRPLYRWHISGHGAIAVLEQLTPWLRVKQAHAWLAKEFWAQRTLCPGRVKLSPEERALREGYFLAMKTLNHPQKETNDNQG